MPWTWMTLLGCLLIPSFADATPPERMHYQGYLTHVAGSPVECPNALNCDQTLDMTFRLYSDPTANALLWEELHPAVSVVDGMFQVTLGALDPLTPELFNGPTFLGIEINGNGEMEPRQEMVSAAFALRATAAMNAAFLGGVPAASYVQFDELEALGGVQGPPGPPGPAGSSLWTDVAGVVSTDNDVHMGGKVTINTTNPGSYHLYVAGHAFTTGTWQGSDRRWKENIRTLGDALSTVRSLRGVRYTWRKEEYPHIGLPAGQDIGLIAQEVEEVVPELVQEAQGGFKAIAYGKLAGYLIEAIKQLASIEEVQRLREDLASSDAENAALRDRLSRLEARMTHLEGRSSASR